MAQYAVFNKIDGNGTVAISKDQVAYVQAQNQNEPDSIIVFKVNDKGPGTSIEVMHTVSQVVALLEAN